MTPWIPSSELSRELTNAGAVRPIGYRKLYQLILDGVLPAEKLSGRWFVRSEDLPMIIERLGLDQQQAA